MTNIPKSNRRDKKRQRFERVKDGKAFIIRSTIKLDYKEKRDLMKKTGLSLQKSIHKLVKDYLKE